MVVRSNPIIHTRYCLAVRDQCRQYDIMPYSFDTGALYASRVKECWRVSQCKANRGSRASIGATEPNVVLPRERNKGILAIQATSTSLSFCLVCHLPPDKELSGLMHS